MGKPKPPSIDWILRSWAGSSFYQENMDFSYIFFLSRMLKARKFNTYIYYFTKSQIFLIPFSPVGKREARSSWTSLSVPMVPYSSQNTTSPAWWSAHLHFSWFQVSFNTQTQTLVCWTAHPGGTDIFFDLLHHSLPSHLK